MKQDWTWLDIVGDRLLPALPGVGGQIKQGILHARIPPKALMATTFGEISGFVTERLEKLVKIFETAKLAYAINKDMKSYLITHSVSDIALLNVLHFDDKTVRTRTTAHKSTVTLKSYLRALQKAGVAINPSSFKMVLKIPDSILDFFFMMWLRTKMVKIISRRKHETDASCAGVCACSYTVSRATGSRFSSLATLWNAPEFLLRALLRSFWQCSSRARSLPSILPYSSPGSSG